MSGLSGVVNEWLLKKADTSVNMWQKNKWTYQWGMIFNVGGLLIQNLAEVISPSESTSSSEGTSSLFSGFFRGYNFWVCCLVVANVLLGTSVSLILKYFDNVVKGFGFTLIIFTVTFFSW